jgi:hypothetical protein
MKGIEGNKCGGGGKGFVDGEKVCGGGGKVSGVEEK